MSFARPEPFASTPQDKLVGLCVLIAFGIVFWLSVISDSTGRHEMGKSKFRTELSQSYGIVPGAKVSISGVTIGQIDAVSLTDNATVAVDISLDNEYSRFFTQGSQVLVESAIGLNTVLSGVGLVFKSGGVDSPKLQESAFIEAVEPKSLNQLMEEWNVQALLKQVTGIVANIDSVVETLGDNQENLTNTLNSTSHLMESLAKSAEDFPALMKNLNQIADNTNTLLSKIDGSYAQSDEKMQELMLTSTQMVRDMNQLVVTIDSAAQASPELIESLTMTSNRMTLLLSKVSNHWLLGGQSGNEKSENSLISLGDDSLYRSNQITTN